MQGGSEPTIAAPRDKCCALCRRQAVRKPPISGVGMGSLLARIRWEDASCASVNTVETLSQEPPKRQMCSPGMRNRFWERAESHGRDAPNMARTPLSDYPELLGMVTQFLDPSESHMLLSAPLCWSYYLQATCNSNLWKQLCSSNPWHLPRESLSACQCSCRAHHTGLALDRCLAYSLQTKHRSFVQCVRCLHSNEADRAFTLNHVCRSMAAFKDVLGIQIECLEAATKLLEIEEARAIAQASDLTHHVVVCLNHFRSHMRVQSIGLHTLVLLARPLGGREGSVHIGYAPALPALEGPRGGIDTVMAVMDKWIEDPDIQAMACWSLVNFALSNARKLLLLKNGSLARVLRAMKRHACDREVQFRALFALINLVVPGRTGAPCEAAEAVVECAVCAMERFIDDQRLMNRGCLVLQNLSLNDFNRAALSHPRVRDVLQLAAIHYAQRDLMLQQSARATLIRLFGVRAVSWLQEHGASGRSMQRAMHEHTEQAAPCS